MEQNRSKKIYIILLFLLIAFHCMNNYIWSSIDCLPSGVDTIHNLNDQMKFYAKLKFISSNIGFKVGIKNLFSFYLSLFSVADPRNNTMHFIPSVLSIFFGPSLLLTRMTNLIYFIILILAVYFIGKKMLDKKIGLLAAFLVSFYPSIYGVSRQYEHDFPATAMVALCICLLLYTDYFRNKKYSLLFGIFLGLGVFFRGQTLFFVMGPIFYILYRAFIKNKQEYFTKTFNLILSISLALLISSIWWGRNLRGLLENLWHHIVVYYVPYAPSLRYVYDPMMQEWGLTIRTFSFNWFFFYLFSTITHISSFFFLIFIIGLFIFVKSNKIKEGLIIILWTIIPYIIFTIISVKFGHYYFPSFPAIALISAAGILALKQRIIKIISVVLILGFGIIQFFDPSYGMLRIPHLQFSLPLRFYNFHSYPRINNHRQAIVDFAEVIKQMTAKDQDINVGIITGRDPHIQYFLRLSLPKVLISPALHGGILPLNLDFLIVSGRPDSDSPYYERLRYIYEEWSIGEKKGLSGKDLVQQEEIDKKNIAFIDKMIGEFKNYKILKKSLLLPEKESIFLTRSPPKPILKVDKEITISAKNFHSSYNIAVDTGLNAGMIFAQPRGPCFVEYRLILLSPGKYELWVEYATEESRPVDIYLNNRLIIKEGLKEETGSFYKDTLTWFREGVFAIPQPGEYILRLASDNLIPSLNTIRIRKSME